MEGIVIAVIVSLSVALWLHYQCPEDDDDFGGPSDRGGYT